MCSQHHFDNNTSKRHFSSTVVVWESWCCCSSAVLWVYQILLFCEYEKSRSANRYKISPTENMAEYNCKDIKRDRSRNQDAKRSGRPKSTTTKEVAPKVHKSLVNDHRLKLESRLLAYWKKGPYLGHKQIVSKVGAAFADIRLMAMMNQHQKSWKVSHLQENSWSVFWDAKSILCVNYLESSRKINTKYYVNLLGQSKQKMKE